MMNSKLSSPEAPNQHALAGCVQSLIPSLADTRGREICAKAGKSSDATGV